MRKQRQFFFFCLSTVLSLFFVACSKDAGKQFEAYRVTVQNDTGYTSEKIPGFMTFLKSDTPPGDTIKNESFDAYKKGSDGKNVKAEGTVLTVYFTDAAKTVKYDPKTFTQKQNATLYVKFETVPFPIISLGSGKAGGEATEAKNNDTGVSNRPDIFWRAANTLGWLLTYKVLLDKVNPPVAIANAPAKPTDAYQKQLKFTPGKDLDPNTKYYWTVVPIDNDNVEHPISEVFSFTTK